MKYLKELNGESFDFDITKKLCMYVFIFLIGAIAGFIYEELYYLIADKKLVYQGFLYGPYLPVYGFGAVIMLPLLKKVKKNPLFVFLGAMLLTGIVEYITGYAMFQIFHKTWWDYTGLFLNINGYVCLRSVLNFAVGGILLIYIIDPLVCKFVNKSNKFNLSYSSVLIVAVFLIDFMLTLLFRNTIN